VDDRDVVAHLGGDEFVIVRVAEDAIADAASLAKRMQEAIGEAFDLDGHITVVGASVGIAIAPSDGADPDELLKNADLALHRAKSEGYGEIHFFEPGMDQRMQARRLLEHDLRNALARGEFELYYQPVVNLERNEISSFEALLRWHHPQRGMVSPAQFVPLAEETGLIVPIGEWTVRQACAEASRWPKAITVAVNISAVHFKSGNLVRTVVGALAVSGLAASRLELEVTETVLLQDSDAAIATLQRLHDLGVRIALDDFGTGYSSLSYLRSFCFDKIKIDRSFIADLGEANEEALAIIRSVTRLGISLGMETTAEGVETKQQLEMVRAEGCTEMQGYYFSPPRPAEEIEELFLSDMRKAASAA
jgi:predicted signal transduction protein with EAL and GGDEF domain